MYRKPSTAIAACIKLGVYIDPDVHNKDTHLKSQFMCHALDRLCGFHKLITHDLQMEATELIVEKLKGISPKSMQYNTITLDSVLKDIGEYEDESDVKHTRRLKFWKEFIKELKKQGK